jgi:thiamine monophosphate kinase
MRALFTENAVAAAIDDSDGLLPSVDQLASMNGSQANIDLEKLVADSD